MSTNIYLGKKFNKFGTEVSIHLCQSCGNTFTICPFITEQRAKNWGGCLSVECESYESNRDANKYFENNAVGRIPTGKYN